MTSSKPWASAQSRRRPTRRAATGSSGPRLGTNSRRAPVASPAGRRPCWSRGATALGGSSADLVVVVKPWLLLPSVFVAIVWRCAFGAYWPQILGDAPIQGVPVVLEAGSADPNIFRSKPVVDGAGPTLVEVGLEVFAETPHACLAVVMVPGLRPLAIRTPRERNPGQLLQIACGPTEIRRIIHGVDDAGALALSQQRLCPSPRCAADRANPEHGPWVLGVVVTDRTGASATMGAVVSEEALDRLDGLSDGALLVLAYLARYPGSGAAAIRRATGVGVVGVRVALRRLKARGLVEYRGNDSGPGWMATGSVGNLGALGYVSRVLGEAQGQPDGLRSFGVGRFGRLGSDRGPPMFSAKWALCEAQDRPSSAVSVGFGSSA